MINYKFVCSECAETDIKKQNEKYPHLCNSCKEQVDREEVSIFFPVNLCKQCGYQWTPRKLKVVMCPKCKSRRWKEIKK